MSLVALADEVQGASDKTICGYESVTCFSEQKFPLRFINPYIVGIDFDGKEVCPPS